jgi:hypothetical protein
MISPIKSIPDKVIAPLVCVVLLFSLIYIVSAQSTNTIVNAQASTNQPSVSSTLTVTLKISNVQNLAGIDATFQWNPSILSLNGVVLNLGVELHSNGVLHGTNLNYDSNNLNSGDIYVQETKVAGSYNIVAQSIGASNPGFSGSGTIATLTFSVLSSGPAGLSLQTDLANHPPAGQNANNINHQDTVDSVTAVAQSSSSSPASSSTPGTSSTPGSSPSVPEFPIITIIAITIVIVTAALVLATKQLSKNKNP